MVARDIDIINISQIADIFMLHIYRHWKGAACITHKLRNFTETTKEMISYTSIIINLNLVV